MELFVPLRKIVKPWLFSFIGSALILGSTFISGNLIFEKEKEFQETENEIRNLENRYSKADKDAYAGKLIFDLSYIQRTIIKMSGFQDKAIQEPWEKTHALELYSGVLYMLLASGENLNENVMEKFKAIRDRAIKGDKEAFYNLNTQYLELIEKAAYYKGKIIIEKSKLQTIADNIGKEVISFRKHAFFFQIFGLIILLLKDLPNSFFKETKK